MGIIDLISPTGYIITSRALLGIYGSDCALLMCELISEHQYFSSKGMLKDGYFFTTVDNIYNTVFLNAHAQRKAIDTLVKDGVLCKKQVGCPPRRYIKINEEVLIKRVSEFVLPPVPDYSKGAEFEPLNVQNMNDVGEESEPMNVQNLNLPLYNNNNINNNNNKYILSGKPDEEPVMDKVREIVDYLNTRAGKAYKSTTPKTVRFIKARIKEGFTVDDFKVVIDAKVIEWGKDKKMKEYLRPETLFGTKFEGYLNNAPKKPKETQEKRPAIQLKPLNEEWGI